MTRPSWDSYFMEVARLVATRATCDRRKCGAVFVSPNHHILSTGYNGSLPGLSHCDDVGHLIEDGHCIRTIHAESNAIAHAAAHGVSLFGSDLYVNYTPCKNCFKLAISAGVCRVIIGEAYRQWDEMQQMAEDSLVEVVYL